MKSHSIASRKRTMQSYYISILQSRNSVKKKTETRSRRTNSVENIWSFRILIDLILWQILVRSEKLDSALFASMHARRIRCITFRIDFSIIFSFWHCIDISNESSTVKSHRNSIIDVARNIWELWDTMMLSRSWCDLHSRQHRTTQTIDICFMMYLLVNFRYQISHRCHISSRHSERRNFSNARSHVLQFDFTSYLKLWISICSFLQSSHRCMI